MTDTTTVFFHDGAFRITCPFFDNDRPKSAPDREWNKETKTWVLPLSGGNVRHIDEMFLPTELTPTATTAIDKFKQEELRSIERVAFPDDYALPGTPMSNQREALDKAWGKDQFAFFHEMRLGKTYTAIQLACASWLHDKIDQVLVICPTSIKIVWRNQLEEWVPEDVPYISMVHNSNAHKATQEFIRRVPQAPVIRFLIVGVEGLSSGRAIEHATKYVEWDRTLVIVDESSTIKSPNKIRTRNCIALGAKATMRAILTGTPVTQGIQDLYAQFQFLNDGILGMKTYVAFRNRYCVMGGFENKKIVGYRRTRELLELIAPWAHRAQTKDVLDLPPKIFEERWAEATPQQEKATKELKKEFVIRYDDGGEMEVDTILERMLRYQQIAGGQLPRWNEDTREFYTDDLPGKNPKLDELMAINDELPKDVKIIVWARFRPEIAMIVKALRRAGEAVVEFHGGVSEEDRAQAVDHFQNKHTRWFIANQMTGGMGLELSAATCVVYFSNTFSYVDRVQSEARTQSSKQTKSVLYIDLRSTLAVDVAIAKAIENKSSMAEFVSSNLKEGVITDVVS